MCLPEEATPTPMQPSSEECSAPWSVSRNYPKNIWKRWWMSDSKAVGKTREEKTVRLVMNPASPSRQLSTRLENGSQPRANDMKQSCPTQLYNTATANVPKQFLGLIPHSFLSLAYSTAWVQRTQVNNLSNFVSFQLCLHHTLYFVRSTWPLWNFCLVLGNFLDLLCEVLTVVFPWFDWFDCIWRLFWVKLQNEMTYLVLNNFPYHQMLLRL